MTKNNKITVHLKLLQKMIQIKTNKTSIKSTNAIYRNNKNGKNTTKLLNLYLK